MQTLIIQAYTLLVIASGLLTQLANTPNATPELRAQVETTAEVAISYANSVISSQKTITTTIAPEPPQTAISTPVCVSTPTLELSTTTISSKVVINSTYTDNCDIDTNTVYSYFFDTFQYQDEYTTQIGKDDNVGYTQTKLSPKQFVHSYYIPLGQVPKTYHYTFKVGNFVKELWQ